MVKPNVLVMGGDDQSYHDFSLIGPLFESILNETGCNTTVSEDVSFFAPERIKAFDILVCYMNKQQIRPEEEKGLLNSVIGDPWGNIGKPKGFIGIHTAACSFTASENYRRMIGCRFLIHPEFGDEYLIEVKNPHHPIMEGIEAFPIKDELYLLEIYPPFETLLACNYRGFDHPIAWIKPYGRGIVFYLTLGHSTEQLGNPNVRRIITNAVFWTYKMINSPGR